MAHYTPANFAAAWRTPHAEYAGIEAGKKGMGTNKDFKNQSPVLKRWQGQFNLTARDEWLAQYGFDVIS